MLVDAVTLADRSHEHTVCETFDGQPIPPESVRRIACDAVIIPIVVNAAGVVLDHGHGRRMATIEQRRALRAMYRSCGFPDCTVRFGDCEVHHVIEWVQHRGPTNLDNLLPLCNQHHHLVHEGGWHLELFPDRRLIVRRPDGTVLFDGSTVDVAARDAAAVRAGVLGLTPSPLAHRDAAGVLRWPGSGRRSGSECLVRLASASASGPPPAIPVRGDLVVRLPPHDHSECPTP